MVFRFGSRIIHCIGNLGCQLFAYFTKKKKKDPLGIEKGIHLANETKSDYCAINDFIFEFIKSRTNIKRKEKKAQSRRKGTSVSPYWSFVCSFGEAEETIAEGKKKNALQKQVTEEMQ